jgi:hypothetical protein
MQQSVIFKGLLLGVNSEISQHFAVAFINVCSKSNPETQYILPPQSLAKLMSSISSGHP